MWNSSRSQFARQREVTQSETSSSCRGCVSVRNSPSRIVRPLSAIAVVPALLSASVNETRVRNSPSRAISHL